MQIEVLKIDELVFDPANARKHSKKNLDAIIGSLSKFGQQKPIVVDKNNVVVAGNGTLEAAKKIGWSKINCVRTDLTGPEAIAFALADNRTAELAEWDVEPLTKTLQSLKDIDFDLGSIGFDDDFMEAHTPKVDNPGLTDPDEVPQNVETRCKPGDLWILGNHRLLCNDSTNVQHVERLMGGEKADMVYTDPPYGIKLNTNYQRTDRVKGKSYKPIEGDSDHFDPSFLLSEFDSAREIFLWGADNFCGALPAGGSWIVWDKSNTAMDKIAQSGDFELCWSRKRHKYSMFRKLWSGFTAKERNETRVHPTQKPIEMGEWFFERWGKPNDLVIDLFLGSGSTLIACEKTGRKCFGMEIDPHYCDVIIKRWEDFTGNKATLKSE